MGMFDDVRCEYPLPDGWEPRGLQTKDLGCDLRLATITAEGRLLYDDRRYWAGGEENIVDTNFHGDFRFYGHEGQQPGTSQWVWHEYVARFTEGQLVRITVVPEAASPTPLPLT